QQQAQGKPGDERRAQVDLRQAEGARGESLCGKRATDRERAVERLGAEIEPSDVENEQRRERGNLIMTRVGKEPTRQRTGHWRSPREANQCRRDSRAQRRRKGRSVAKRWRRDRAPL